MAISRSDRNERRRDARWAPSWDMGNALASSPPEHRAWGAVTVGVLPPVAGERADTRRGARREDGGDRGEVRPGGGADDPGSARGSGRGRETTGSCRGGRRSSVFQPVCQRWIGLGALQKYASPGFRVPPPDAPCRHGRWDGVPAPDVDRMPRDRSFGRAIDQSGPGPPPSVRCCRSTHRLCSPRSGLAPRRLDDVKDGERETISLFRSRACMRDAGPPGV